MTGRSGNSNSQDEKMQGDLGTYGVRLEMMERVGEVGVKWTRRLLYVWGYG